MKQGKLFWPLVVGLVLVLAPGVPGADQRHREMGHPGAVVADIRGLHGGHRGGGGDDGADARATCHHFHLRPHHHPPLQDDLLARAYRADDREQVLVDMWQQFEKLSAFCPIPSRNKKETQHA